MRLKRYIAVRCPRCRQLQGRDRRLTVFGYRGPHKTFRCYTCGYRIPVTEETSLYASDDAEELAYFVGLRKAADHIADGAFRRCDVEE